MARVDASGRHDARVPSVQVGGVTVPKAGEEVCGDAFAVAAARACPPVVVVDGLGHGLGAADAARLAVAAFESAPDLSPAAQVAAIHDALRGTRGAAVAVARIDPARGQLAYSRASATSRGRSSRARVTRHLVSGNGTAGHSAGRINEFAYPWSDDALLVMHSDGLGSRWQIGSYPGPAQPPSLRGRGHPLPGLEPGPRRRHGRGGPAPPS